jgi:hypothetical protein
MNWLIERADIDQLLCHDHLMDVAHLSKIKPPSSPEVQYLVCWAFF